MVFLFEHGDYYWLLLEHMRLTSEGEPHGGDPWSIHRERLQAEGGLARAVWPRK